jgi:hypothetical protein
MAKRKAAAQEQLSAEPDVFDEQIAARQEEANRPQETASAAVVPEPPPQQDGQPTQRRSPDPFTIARDDKAGVRLLESRQYRQMQLKFAEKPDRVILDKVKEAGFRWNGEAWTKQIQQATALQTRIDAERLFQDVVDMIREQKGTGQAR